MYAFNLILFLFCVLMPVAFLYAVLFYAFLFFFFIILSLSLLLKFNVISLQMPNTLDNSADTEELKCVGGV